MTMMVNNYENTKTADIIADALVDWGAPVVFGIPDDGINSLMDF
jgi:pyruvate dehydrogenase (quinone)